MQSVNLDLSEICERILEAFESSLFINPAHSDDRLAENNSLSDHKTISTSDKSSCDTKNVLRSDTNIQEELKSLRLLRARIGLRMIK